MKKFKFIGAVLALTVSFVVLTDTKETAGPTHPPINAYNQLLDAPTHPPIN